jgi:hypothetical protein
MGNTKAYFIALCIVVATVGQCFAELTGNQMREGCQLSVDRRPNVNVTLNDALKSGTCEGFVYAMGALGGLLAEPDRFCHPYGVDVEQGERVLLKYLNEHPELTHEDAVLLSLQAFKAAWPCQ